MAYFPNGTSFDNEAARMCFKCVHEDGCPVLELHFMWNYDAVRSNADETKRTALNTLWPIEEDGVFNRDCGLFYAR